MSYDYYYAAIFANHTGFNVSILEINNYERPDIIRLIASSSSHIVSNKLIFETMSELMDKTGKFEYTIKVGDLFVGVLLNKNKSLAAAIRAYSSRWIIDTYESKDVGESLYNVAVKLGDGKLNVDASLLKDVNFDLARSTDTDIPHRMNALIIVCDCWGRYRHLGRNLPQQSRIHGLVY